MMKKKGKENNGFSLPQGNNGVSLPQEIIFEILKEIPAKILFRFRCVSKLWLSIIDDPLFVESHHNRSINRPDGINLLLLKSPTSYIYHVDSQFYSIDPEGRSFLHLQSLESLHDTADFLPSPLYSVKSLICFHNCIWNPSTREIQEIPPIRRRSPTFSFPGGDNSLRVVSLNLLWFKPAASGRKHKVLKHYQTDQNRSSPYS
ncbi:putative F-box protein At1g47790 [Cornus florida]|uniref:putative F-box protein At1g47790 n=1 Tax=Cornus florida TaxID=4283 RepID=UPI0028989068|nr:putative F-box protein At1g47790 [Cornus florida]